MIQHTPTADLFKRLSNLLERQTRNSPGIRFAKNANVYTSGDRDESVYYVVSGQIKLLMNSPEGKECLLAIYTSGDVFGETCFSGLGARQETATAMSETVIKQIPRSKFFSLLTNRMMLEGFVRYLAVRISDLQDAISNLATVDSEQRLGKTLLRLARKLGKKHPRSIRIEQWISHEELAAMVGTTRPRITEFMGRFRDLHLIEIVAGHFIIVKEKKLTAYLDRNAL